MELDTLLNAGTKAFAFVRDELANTENARIIVHQSLRVLDRNGKLRDFANRSARSTDVRLQLSANILFASIQAILKSSVEQETL